MTFKREIAVRGASAPELSKPKSVFNDADEFAASFRMAQALAKTQLVPKAFQGHPEDCLIALDYARRLDVAPQAIMPHLFVVYGTPSMSAQMMIALVNRSGRFSRIAWDEGVDGKLTYPDVKGKSVEIPNYYASAWFIERLTNTKIVSPRVDMRTAFSNGWLTKGHDKGAVSKWEQIPQTMLRYRSASMLIKTTCPELMLGMDVAEDARDNAGAIEYPETTVETLPESLESAPETQDSTAIDEIVAAIDATKSLDELNVLANQIAQADFSEDELEQIRAPYLAKKNTLTAGQVAEG